MGITEQSAEGSRSPAVGRETAARAAAAAGGDPETVYFTARAVGAVHRDRAGGAGLAQAVEFPGYLK